MIFGGEGGGVGMVGRARRVRYLLSGYDRRVLRCGGSG